MVTPQCVPSCPALKGPYSPEELLDVALRYVKKHIQLPEAAQQDAASEFVLAALKAQAHSTSERGVRSYQFLYGRGAAIRFAEEYDRFNDLAPVSLNALFFSAEMSGTGDDAEVWEGEPDAALIADTLTPEEILSQRETSQTVQNILAGLPERTQDILEMHAVQKLSYECIGNWLYIPFKKICRIYVDAVCLLYEGCYCARALAAKSPARQLGAFFRAQQK